MSAFGTWPATIITMNPAHMNTCLSQSDAHRVPRQRVWEVECLNSGLTQNTQPPMWPARG
jgi:hypothetical protein